MGLCAEKTAADAKIERKLQDDFAIMSYERSQASQRNGVFNWEITPVTISENEKVTEDEECKKFLKDKILQLKPVFSKTGTITAANASKINDGACSLSFTFNSVLMSEEKVNETKTKPLAKILSFADGETDPIDFCIAPQKAIQTALKRANVSLSAIDFFEINEAFAVTVLANMKLMDIDIDKVNVNGGAVSLGHPIGMSGARIVLSLVNTLQRGEGKYGCAAICNGGGGSTAMIIERV